MSADASSKVVIGGGKRRLPLGPHARVVVLLAGAVIFLAALAGGGYLLFHKTSTPKTTTTITTKKQNVAILLKQQQTAGYKEYSSLIAAKKYDEARKYVNTKMPITQAEKDSLLKDIDALTSDKTAEIQGYLAEEKAGILTYDKANLLGDIYAAQGNKASAKTYYQKAIDLLNKSSSPVKEDEILHIKGKINAL